METGRLSCDHTERQFVRQVHSHGTHVLEQCLKCLANVRGPGIWVPRAELVGVDLASLPLKREAARTPSLFD